MHDTDLPECETGSCVMRHETRPGSTVITSRHEDDCPDRPKENR